MLKTEVLIVGGGPAGAIAAKYLSKAGVQNILVQRNFGFKKPCGGGIRLDAFDEFEIDKSVIEKYVDTIALVYKDQCIEVDISQTPLGIVDRTTFDARLREDAKDEGTTLLEASFTTLQIEQEYILATILLNGEHQQIKSRYIIAADGVNSKVRRIVNGDYVSSGMTNYADIESKSYSQCEFHFGSNIADRYYAWAFPHASGSNIGTLADKGQNYIKNFMHHLGVQEDVKINGYKIPHFQNNIFYKDNVFFVGDSASQVLPFTYEGIYYAMSSAKILANVIAEKKPPQSYEQEWKKSHLKRFQTLLRLQNIFLKNDFMISLMMRLYRHKHIQKQVVLFWLGKRDIDINFSFFIRAFKKIIYK